MLGRTSENASLSAPRIAKPNLTSRLPASWTSLGVGLEADAGFGMQSLYLAGCLGLLELRHDGSLRALLGVCPAWLETSCWELAVFYSTLLKWFKMEELWLSDEQHFWSYFGRLVLALLLCRCSSSSFAVFAEFNFFPILEFGAQFWWRFFECESIRHSSVQSFLTSLTVIPC